MSVLTTVKRCNIPEDYILHSHRRENLKSYIEIQISSKHLPHMLRSAQRLHKSGSNVRNHRKIMISLLLYSAPSNENWLWRDERDKLNTYC
jgi:hypothetical protein